MQWPRVEEDGGEQAPDLPSPNDGRRVDATKFGQHADGGREPGHALGRAKPHGHLGQVDGHVNEGHGDGEGGGGGAEVALVTLAARVPKEARAPHHQARRADGARLPIARERIP